MVSKTPCDRGSVFFIIPLLPGKFKPYFPLGPLFGDGNLPKPAEAGGAVGYKKIAKKPDTKFCVFGLQYPQHVV